MASLLNESQQMLAYLDSQLAQLDTSSVDSASLASSSRAALHTGPSSSSSTLGGMGARGATAKGGPFDGVRPRALSNGSDGGRASSTSSGSSSGRPLGSTAADIQRSIARLEERLERTEADARRTRHGRGGNGRAYADEAGTKSAPTSAHTSPVRTKVTAELYAKSPWRVDFEERYRDLVRKYVDDSNIGEMSSSTAAAGLSASMFAPTGASSSANSSTAAVSRSVMHASAVEPRTAPAHAWPAHAPQPRSLAPAFQEMPAPQTAPKAAPAASPGKVLLTAADISQLLARTEEKEKIETLETQLRELKSQFTSMQHGDAPSRKAKPSESARPRPRKVRAAAHESYARPTKTTMHSRELQELRAKLAQANKANEAMQTRLRKKDRQIESLQRDVHSLRSNLRKEKREGENKQARIDELQAGLDQVSKLATRPRTPVRSKKAVAVQRVARL